MRDTENLHTVLMLSLIHISSWNEYLIKFGNYQQKRQAIIEKYDKAIKEAGTAGDAAILMKEKANVLDDFDNSVKNSTTLMLSLIHI